MTMRHNTGQPLSFQVQAIEEKDVLPYCKDMFASQHYIVLDSDDGTRLDFFIARNLSCGQRTAKRLISNGGVSVNGKTKPAHYKIMTGMEVTVSDTVPENKTENAFSVETTPVVANKDYAVFYKPGGLHTAKISGSTSTSLEESLTGRVPPVTLLSRLDLDTSGLVVAAFSSNAVENFKKLEAEGSVRKEYLAVVRGILKEPILLQNALDTDNRKITRVLDTLTVDATRFTEVKPLDLAPPVMNASLVVATIMRGARHQIRAHLAFAGYPIIGDSLYGESDSPRPLYLHHTRLRFPGITAFRPPPWLSDFLEDFL